jgi:hypothetical protein
MVTDHEPDFRIAVISLAVLSGSILLVRHAVVDALQGVQQPTLNGRGAIWFAIEMVGGSSIAWIVVNTYARRLWRWRLFRILNAFLGLPPDVNGWWTGSYQRYDSSRGEPQVAAACAFRIDQTLWSTHIIGWGEHSNYSESYSVRWLSDKGRHHYKLAWLYIAKRNEAQADPGGFHLGLHEMHYLPAQCGAPPRLTGWYLNNRHCSVTKDGVRVEWTGSTADITLSFVGPEPDENACMIVARSTVPLKQLGPMDEGRTSPAIEPSVPKPS